MTAAPPVPLRRPGRRRRDASADVGRPRPARRGATATACLTMPDHFTDQLAPVPALMSAADATTTLRIGALVWDNDYKHPVVLAKELATIDVLSEGRLEIGLGAGWMITDYEQAGMPVRPAPVSASTASSRASTIIRGRCRPRAVLLRRRALHDHRLRRPAQAGAAPSRRSSSAAAASGCWPSPAARPTSSASTARCTRARSAPDAGHDDRRGRRREGRLRARRRRRPAAPTSRSTSACSSSTSPTIATGRSPIVRRRSVAEPTMLETTPFALHRHAGEDRRGPARPARAVGLLVHHRRAPRTSSRSPRSSPSSPAADMTDGVALCGAGWIAAAHAARRTRGRVRAHRRRVAHPRASRATRRRSGRRRAVDLRRAPRRRRHRGRVPPRRRPRRRRVRLLGGRRRRAAGEAAVPHARPRPTRIVAAAAAHGERLLYAENLAYAPAFVELRRPRRHARSARPTSRSARSRPCRRGATSPPTSGAAARCSTSACTRWHSPCCSPRRPARAGRRRSRRRCAAATATAPTSTPR